MSDLLSSKIDRIKRALKRIHDVYGDGKSFKQDYTQQDSVVLNLQRTCEACIDISNHINRRHQYGVPQSSRDSFTLLAQNNVLPTALAENLKKMVGFTDLFTGPKAVHDYQELNLDIVIHVIKHHLSDFNDFVDVIKAQA